MQFPGDLARDVLDRPIGRIEPGRKWTRVGIGLLVTGAIAAGLVVALRTSPVEPQKIWVSPSPSPVAEATVPTEPADPISLSPGEVPSWTDVAASTSLSASSPTFTFVGAEASSFDDDSSSSSESSTDSSSSREAS